MTEHQWVDADEALEEAAVREGSLTGRAVPVRRREPEEMSDADVDEILEDAHSAGD